MLKTYGLKMEGIKKASGNTLNWSARSGGYSEVFYDTLYGEVWTVSHVSIGRNEWTRYNSRYIIRVCVTDRHLSMRQIADKIHDYMTYLSGELEALARNLYENKPDNSKMSPADAHRVLEYMEDVPDGVTSHSLAAAYNALL